MEEKDRKTMSPAEYFEELKSLKQENTDESLNQFYEAALTLMAKYKLFNQKKMIEKLAFIIECVPKEKQLLDLGVNIFIYKDDIEEYINEVENKVVKIINIEDYPRDIPEEFSPIISATSEIFDAFYVLFTDYNGKEERRVAKERREKDPILLGVFKKNRLMNDRFYYLGDWEDEYCDLTLEKLISEAGEEIIHNTTIPVDKKELLEELNKLNEKDGKFTINTGGLTSSFVTSISGTNSSTTHPVNVINILTEELNRDGSEDRSNVE